MNKVLLKELCIVDGHGKYGIPAPAEGFDIKKFRYLRISDISDDGYLHDENKKSVSSEDAEKYLLKEGDIVFARTGNSTGRTYYHEDKFGQLVYAGFLIKYSLDFKKVNPKYLKYYTLSTHYKTWVDNLSLGSTRGNINAKTFSSCLIPLPSREQQDFLVSVLSSLDKKIELNNRINSELESMAKLLYNYWFVQFDFPNENGKPYKSSGDTMVYSEVMKRNIPAGWKVKGMDELCTRIGDGLHSTPKYVDDSEYSFINGNNLKNGFVNITENTKKVDYKEFTKHHIDLNENTLFLSINGTIGNVATYGNEKVILGKSAAYLNYKPEFLPICNYYFQQDYIQKSLWQISTGSTIKNLSLKSIRNLKILIPEDRILQRFNKIVKPLMAKNRVMFLENQELAKLRDWLLPMLMNGQVRVE